MGDIGLFRQGWKWIHSQKQAFETQVPLGCIRDRLIFLIDQHWPLVVQWCVDLGKLISKLLLLWRDCLVRSFRSLISLGVTALFLIIWSCFLSLTSTACLVYVLLSMGAAGVAIWFLGYPCGLLIVGLFGILIISKFSNFWTTGMLFIIGGYMVSRSHARVIVIVLAAYALYCVHALAGWSGVFLVLNLSFLSNDLLHKLLQGYDCASKGRASEEQNASEPVVDDSSSHFGFFTQTTDGEASSKSSVKTYVKRGISDDQKDAYFGKTAKTVSASIDEIKRIINCLDHYEALGFTRNKSIDATTLKKEYYKKAVLVHPDKNMGNPLSSESFKKLQCAYETLSDFAKKKSYDEQLRKEEFEKVAQRTCSASRQDEMDFHYEESRRIGCTKCRNSHLWICVKRSKGNARWCQDCLQFHQAKDGDGWVEYRSTSLVSTSHKVEIPRAFVCAENKIFDVSEWAICQGMTCKPNTHKPTFHVNMVGLEKMEQRSNPPQYPWGLDAEMVQEDEFDLWLQQALASGLFSDSPKRRKSWSPFKIPQKGIKQWRKSP